MRAIFLFALSAACVLGQQPAQEPAPKTQKCAIEGNVVNAATGEAVKKATLLLSTTSGGQSAPVSVDTDDTGHFSFKELAPGQYQLLGSRQGYARQLYGARSNPLSGTTLTLTAGQRISDIVFKLQPNGVISGKVTDEEGEPLANVAVMAMQYAWMRGKRQLMPAGAAMTNDVGEYRVAGLGAGSYVLSVTYRNLMGIAAAAQKTDRPEFGYAPTYFPNSTELKTASPVDVRAGAETRGIDVRLGKTRVVRVKGKLASPPSSGATIVSLVKKGSGISGFAQRNFGIAQPPDGKFEITGVTPGSYLLTATSSLDMQPAGAAQVVEVGDQSIEGIVIPVAGGAEVSGSIVIEGKTAPAAGVEVTFEAIEMLMMPPRATTGADGKFAIKNVTPGRYAVRVAKAPENCYVKSIHLGAQDAEDNEIEVSGAPGALQVVVSPAGASVEGVISDKDAKPMAGIVVALIPKSNRQSLYRNATTDQNGQYSFKAVVPGEYKLVAWEDLELGAWQDPEFVQAFNSKAEALSLDENARVTRRISAIPADETAAVKRALGR